ncbi:hypothetical protein ECDEC1D_2660 [Escherichia coli DEC1D]|nr:hypothetical protein ECDEC1D_2660 [Escherichia coli DEC1D]
MIITVLLSPSFLNVTLPVASTPTQEAELETNNQSPFFLVQSCHYSTDNTPR